MHIVVICQVFHPDTQSTSQLLSGLLRTMAGGELRVTVVTGYTSTIRLRREQFGCVEIRRTGVPIDYRKDVVRRAIHYLCYLTGSTIELWKLRKCSLVVGVTNPPFVPVWLWLLSKWFLKRYQLMLQDIYPEGLIAIGALDKQAWVTRTWQAANIKAFRAADRILVLGRDMQELVHSNYAVANDRIEYIPHWSVLTLERPIPAEQTELYGELNLQGKFIIQYSGNMGLWHDIDSIVRAAAQLQEYPEVHFLMIGGGVRRSGARQLADGLQLQNMTWLPYQPKESLQDSLSCCHLALISQRKGLKGIAVPCKLYGILAAGRPILAMVPPGSEIDLVLQEEECGRAVSPGDPTQIAAMIVALRQDVALLNRMGENSFHAYQEKYTLSRAVSVFGKIWGGEPATACQE